MADGDGEIVVSVTPGEDSSPDQGGSDPVGVAAGHAEATAEHAATTADEAAETAEIAASEANIATSIALDSDERVRNLETIVTGIAANQQAQSQAIEALAESLRALVELNVQEKTPDPAPVKPDTVPNPGGWYHKPMFKR